MTTYDEELLAICAGTVTPNLSDAMDQLGIPGAMLGIGPLRNANVRAVGYARTVLQGPRRHGVSPGQSLARHVGLVDGNLRAGDFVVIAGIGGVAASSWGHLLSLRSRASGARGTVIDGPVRDPAGIVATGYPMFCRPTYCSAGSKARLETLAVDEPVSCGGVIVRPGDLIAADDSGVVVIPPERAREVIDIARRIAATETQTAARILAGERLAG